MPDAAIDLDQRFQVAGPSVIAKDFGDESVVANLDTGLFFSLTGTAQAIWNALTAGHSLDEVLRSFRSDVYSAEARASAVEVFVRRLVAEQLLAVATRPVVADAPLAGASVEYALPEMDKFDDLQGLLLVDPIHDVSEQGWPLLPDGSRAS